MIDTLIVLAKRPAPGRVKTRLVPPLTPSQAADVAAAALTDTFDAVSITPSRRKLLAFDAAPGRWLRPGWDFAPQPPGALDRRLAAAFASAGSGSALLVGMDTPQLRPEWLTEFDTARYDACLGPARDGGYWAIGFRTPALAAAAIHDVPMSQPGTGREQLRRLRELGLRVQVLAELTDVDTIDAAELVAAGAPATAFAAELYRVLHQSVARAG